MSAKNLPTSAGSDEATDPWLPMIVIAMGQALMSFNVAALPISMGGMVHDFNVPPTTVGTAIVMYSLGVSGFIMLGAKLGQRFGSKLFFQGAVSLFLVALVLSAATVAVAWILYRPLLAIGLLAIGGGIGYLMGQKLRAYRQKK
jgi:MFS family permease